ncbi:MAG TPA: phosphate ABC transporter substrate-binding/OmpA family protein [Paracoccaceae bacterium]|nr:phosphate ABC transporter substrate-binding/OmpA family protein [Paracoccaceae bacterium]
MRRFTTVAALAASVVLRALPVAAETVTLKSFDNTIALRGELLSFDGEAYHLNTAIGELKIDALQVTCEGPGCPPEDLLRSVFRISGSSTIGAGLMPALIEAYGYSLDADILREATGGEETRFILKGAEERPLAEVTLAAPGSNRAFEELLSRASAIGMASRRIRDREAAAMRTAGLGDLESDANEHIVALDGIAAIVSRENPLPALSVADLAAIFGGRITNWSQIGGRDAPINVYVSNPQQGTRDAFDALVMRPYNVEMAATAREFASHDDVADAVAKDPDGIGFVGLAFVRNARSVPIRLECGLIAIPEPFAIKTEEYPLARRLYLYTTDQPMPPHARRLIDFALSEPAQDVITDAGFVDQRISTLGLDRQGLRLAATLLQEQAEVSVNEVRDMLAVLVNAERLSTTLRFEPGVSALDARARGDIRRLADQIAAGRFAGREVLVIGFTDAVGRADLNRALSIRRAEQVREALVAALPPGAPDNAALTVLGFGEMSPVGCNETFDGRRTNRRVEVWVRDRV